MKSIVKQQNAVQTNKYEKCSFQASEKCRFVCGAAHRMKMNFAARRQSNGRENVIQKIKALNKNKSSFYQDSIFIGCVFFFAVDFFPPFLSFSNSFNAYHWLKYASLQHGARHGELFMQLSPDMNSLCEQKTEKKTIEITYLKSLIYFLRIALLFLCYVIDCAACAWIKMPSQ